MINTIQLLLCSDSDRTVNPLNRNLTPGGSSGGESALITFRGSPLGVGSDIGDFISRCTESIDCM